MKIKWICIVICLINILTAGIASAATPDLEFFPSRVYFSDETTLVVEGNFYNKGSFISWLSEVNVEVVLQTKDGPRIFNRSFADIELMLNQEVRFGKFELHDANKVDFNSWELKTRFF